MPKLMSTTGLAGLLLCAVSVAGAAESGGGQELRLSPELRAFLQAEMRDIAGSVQVMTVALATADWKALESAAEKIRDSYIAHQKLPVAQRQELARALPAGFQAIDAAFHDRADKLARAAAAHDGDLGAFHLYRLTESCVSCHSQYVRYRFTGFAADQENEHRH